MIPLLKQYFLFISISCIRMPAYDNNAWSSLFFVVFIVVCMYIFVSIFLAIVYKNYRMHIKVSVLRCTFSALEVSFFYNIIF